MTWNPNYQSYRSWRKQITKKTESKNKIKRKNCDKFQAYQNNADDIGDNKKNKESNRTENGSLKNPRKSYDCKKEKNQRIQRLAIQVLRKASSGDILKRIQPSLSERDWIIDQRYIYREKPKICITTKKDVSKSQSRPLEFEKTKVYLDKIKWRNEKGDNSKNRIKRSMIIKSFDKNNKDKQKMRRKRQDITEKRGKLVVKSKQTYKENKDGSVYSFDSEIYLTGLTLIE